MRILRPLRSPPLALLWGGMTLSALGDQLYAVALSWIAVSVFGAKAGYLSALNAATVLVAASFTGRWADRWDVHRSMVVADLVRAATLLAVVVAWAGQGGPSAAGLVAAVVVLAVGQAVFQPALQSAIPFLTQDAAMLPAVNGLMDTTERSARLLGPGLVAMLAGTLPAMHFLSLDAATFLVSAIAVLVIDRLRPSRARLVPPPARAPIWDSVARGARAMSSHPLLGYILRTTAVVNGAWFSAYFLALPLLIQQFGITGLGGSGFGAFGSVISAYGCTNLAATLIFGSRPMPRRPQFQMFTGKVMVGSGIVLMGAAMALPPDWRLAGLMAAAAMGAAGGPMQDIPVAVLRQMRLAPSDMAPAVRAYMAATSCGTLLAMLAMPSVIGWAGAVDVMLGCGVVLAGVGLAGLVRYAGWSEPAAG